VSEPIPSMSPTKRRRTPPSAHGEPTVWLTGSALITCIALVAVTLLIIGSEGLVTLWPRPIERVELRNGEVFLGLPMGTETFVPSEDDIERIAEIRAESGDISGVLDAEGRATRHRFRLGNRDIGRDAFVWVPGYEIAGRDPADDAVLVERDEWGVFIGVPSAVLVRTELEEDASRPFDAGETVRTDYGEGPATREIIDESDGVRTVRQTVRVAEGPEATLEAFREIRDGFRERRARIESLQRDEIPRAQDAIDALDWRVRRAEESSVAGAGGAPLAVWLGGLAGVVVFGAVGVRMTRIDHARGLIAGLRVLCFVGAAACLLFVVLERPFARSVVTEAELAEIAAEVEEERAGLITERDALLAEVRMLDRLDQTVRLEIVDPGLGRFAPESQATPDEPMRLSQATRIVETNKLGLAGRAGVYLARWGDFLSKAPGESPGEGGVFPVIVGTVVLTLLLTVTVVPLGVVAAIYLREYATQGVVTSAIRIAINNLAGVPSIVYGMFGLGFFCYTLGGFVDAGPGESAMPVVPWWALILTLVLVIGIAAALSSVGASSGVMKTEREGLSRLAGILAWWGWLACVCLAGYLIWKTPYFGGFFAERLPEQPTFGTRGILWAALTLALLTLPVVIVATEEAISAVPGSMREGSIGCGASRWQTIRRIVLPASLPGVLTGAILAMARGAGEVAPLMLVGAVNLAPALPVSGDAPFLHGDRTFMHLGFHIYNLGFQSPDAEAAGHWCGRRRCCLSRSCWG
jgi:ABC-type phosphate transport system permease subunit